MSLGEEIEKNMRRPFTRWVLLGQHHRTEAYVATMVAFEERTTLLACMCWYVRKEGLVVTQHFFLHKQMPPKRWYIMV